MSEILRTVGIFIGICLIIFISCWADSGWFSDEEIRKRRTKKKVIAEHERKEGK